jgi:peptidoglycan-associated lipoprotein
MHRRFLPLVALLFGIGCSHATAKPTPVRTALAPHPAPPPAVSRQEVVQNAAESQQRARPVGNAIFFDFDSALLRDDSRPTLQQVGTQLTHSKHMVRIEGNCDERGTTEYNLVLGDRRAREAERYLENLGVPERRISIVSYGSERPKAKAHDEAAWAENRRDDLVIR